MADVRWKPDPSSPESAEAAGLDRRWVVRVGDVLDIGRSWRSL